MDTKLYSKTESTPLGARDKSKKRQEFLEAMANFVFYQTRSEDSPSHSMVLSSTRWLCCRQALEQQTTGAIAATVAEGKRRLSKAYKRRTNERTNEEEWITNTS